MNDTTMTRAEHLAWAKQRALEYVDRGEMTNAIASMISDLGKHSELEKSAGLAPFLIFTIDTRDPYSVRRFIEGFN
jgi:hypothetical protein